jgi:hypothetical protein
VDSPPVQYQLVVHWKPIEPVVSIVKLAPFAGEIVSTPLAWGDNCLVGAARAPWSPAVPSAAPPKPTAMGRVSAFVASASPAIA